VRKLLNDYKGKELNGLSKKLEAVIHKYIAPRWNQREPTTTKKGK
jgi:hypothetical protein